MALTQQNSEPLRPSTYCQRALNAILVSEERRKRRKRDTGPDVLGMEIKRDLLKDAIEADPEPEKFEPWLLQRVIESKAGGPVRAMALEILAEYRNACSVESFGGWLEQGAPTPRMSTENEGRKKRRG